MEIIVDSLLTGAQQATGHVAIIDVFRAFTTAAVVNARNTSMMATWPVACLAPVSRLSTMISISDRHYIFL